MIFFDVMWRGVGSEESSRRLNPSILQGSVDSTSNPHLKEPLFSYFTTVGTFGHGVVVELKEGQDVIVYISDG